MINQPEAALQFVELLSHSSLIWEIPTKKLIPTNSSMPAGLLVLLSAGISRQIT
jgi:hypothetical protein